jgi:hypothetical protein
MAVDRRSLSVAATLAAIGIGVAGGTWLAWGPARTPDPRTAAAPAAPGAPAAIEEVHCQVDPAPGPRPVSLVEFDPDTLDPSGAPAVAVDGDWVTFVPRHADGLGQLTVDGFAPRSVGWLDGACLDLVTLAPTAAETRVYGRITGSDADDLAVSGCGRGVLVAEDGTFGFSVGAGAACEVSVSRVFGTRMLAGQRVTIHPVAGAALELTLRAPEPPGGAGWDLLETEDGFRVMAVLDGGPAARAGVVVGDRILRLGDTPGTELAADDAIEIPVPVEVELAGEAGARVVTVAP